MKSQKIMHFKTKAQWGDWVHQLSGIPGLSQADQQYYLTQIEHCHRYGIKGVKSNLVLNEQVDRWMPVLFKIYESNEYLNDLIHLKVPIDPSLKALKENHIQLKKSISSVNRLFNPWFKRSSASFQLRIQINQILKVYLTLIDTVQTGLMHEGMIAQDLYHNIENMKMTYQALLEVLKIEHQDVLIYRAHERAQAKIRIYLAQCPARSHQTLHQFIRKLKECIRWSSGIFVVQLMCLSFGLMLSSDIQAAAWIHMIHQYSSF